MRGEQRASQADNRQVAPGQCVQQAGALEPGDEAEGDEGEGGAPEGDHAGVGLDQGAENTGQPEQDRGDVGDEQSITVTGCRTGTGNRCSSHGSQIFTIVAHTEMVRSCARVHRF